MQTITEQNFLAVRATLGACMDDHEFAAFYEVLEAAEKHPGWGVRQKLVIMLDLAKTLFCEEKVA